MLVAYFRMRDLHLSDYALYSCMHGRFNKISDSGRVLSDRQPPLATGGTEEYSDAHLSGRDGTYVI